MPANPMDADASDARRRAGDLHHRLVEAAVATVHDLGYAGATMAAIAQRAGVTRGALQHYFGNRRVDLVAAVAAEILDERQRTYEEHVSEARPSALFDRAALKAAYRAPKTWFLIEVWIAARGDPELAARIAAIKDRIEAHSDLVLAGAFRRVAGVDFAALKLLLRAAVRGLAVEQIGKTDLAAFDDAVDLLTDALEALQRQRNGRPQTP